MKIRKEDVERLNALYKQIPTVECKGLCTIACANIHVTELEEHRLRVHAHQKLKTLPNGVCQFLKNDRCSIYSLRPMICRIWGVIRSLSCMHGCVPQKWLTFPEFHEIAKEIESITGGPLWQITPEGLKATEYTYRDMHFRSPAEEIEENERMTLAMRALYGGRILAVTRGGPGGWIKMRENNE